MRRCQLPPPASLRHAPDERFRSLVEFAPDALVVVGTDGVIVLVNEATERLTGYPRADLVGRPVEVFIPGQLSVIHADLRRGYMADPQRRAMGDGRPLRLRRRDGTEIAVDISLAPIEWGERAAVAAAIRDVSDRVQSDAALRASEARLAAAERLAALGSWSWEEETGLIHLSAGLQRILGLDADAASMTPGEFYGRVHEADRDSVAATVLASITTGQPMQCEYRIVATDGSIRWVHGRGEVAAWQGNRAVRLTGFCQDISVAREAEQRQRGAQDELARQRGVLEGIARGEPVDQTLETVCHELEAQHPGVWCAIQLVDVAERVLRQVAAPSLPAELRRVLDRLPIAVGLGACATAVSRGEDVIVEDVAADPLMDAFRRLLAEHHLQAVWSHPLVGASGDVLGTLAVYRHETGSPSDEEIRTVTAAASVAALAIERSRTERALTMAAHIDPLTGLPNRNRFLEEVSDRLTEPGARVAVLFLDLDRFKWINDSLGHPAGDVILVEVASRLRRLVRAQDVVARFGGDEFTMLVTSATPAAVGHIAARVEAAFTEPFMLDGGEFFLTVSVGIAMNDATSDASSLVRDADAAMYAAKDNGRARHAMFDERLRERALERITLESELRRAIDRDEFVVHYQPILDLSTGHWVGAEGLTRWQHPTRGLVAPNSFIPLAEETGLIVPLGFRILDQIIAQGAAWAATGLPSRVAANVSVVQLNDPSIASEIESLLSHHRLDPSLLVLEVTESAVMEQLDTARATLDAISALGVDILIDDFGTGYSSIARLGELPVVGVKIDKGFVAALGIHSTAEEVLSAITALAHAHDLQVVAEGIEHREALERVTILGCDFAQGFHLGRPVPPHQLELPTRVVA